MRLILSLIRQHAARHPRTMAAALALSFFMSVLWIAEPLYSSYAIDALLQAQTGESVPYVRIFGLWGLLFLVLSIFQSIQKYAFWQIDHRLLLDRREELYKHVLDLGVPFHTQQKSGEVIKLIDEGADNLVDMQRHLMVELGPSFLAATVFLIISFWIQPILAGILIFSIALYVSVVVIGTVKTAKLQYEVNKLWVEGIGRAYDAITNIFSVVSGAQEEREMDRMKQSNRKAYVTQQRVNLRWAAVEAINFFMLTRILLIGIGILLFIRGDMTLGSLYFFQFSFFRVLTPFEMLSNLLPQWNKRVGKIRMSQNILEKPVEVQAPATGIILPSLRGAVDFENVSFAYGTSVDIIRQHTAFSSLEHESRGVADHEHDMSGGHEGPEDSNGIALTKEEDSGSSALHIRTGNVLDCVSFRVEPGEQIALVGHSGAGKSTLALLLNRFYDATQGTILIDGMDIRSLDMHWWRSQIGLVLQENIMFNDSILENIRYARPDATDEEVRDAARRAASDAFIEALPSKYDTVIGDRGIRLSGGQRQRIAIARAILKRPSIVILDEATSALDSKTEKDVQEGIKELVKGRTAFIIAHRLSTVRSVDRTAVLDKGRLIAFAPHDELVRTCPLYREMVELQHQGLLAE